MVRYLYRIFLLMCVLQPAVVSTAQVSNVSALLAEKLQQQQCEIVATHRVEVAQVGFIQQPELFSFYKACNGELEVTEVEEEEESHFAQRLFYPARFELFVGYNLAFSAIAFECGSVGLIHPVTYLSSARFIAFGNFRI